MTPKVQKALDEMRKSIKVMQNFCVGCTVMKREGPRSYGAPAPVIEGTKLCSVCRKPKYNGEYDND